MEKLYLDTVNRALRKLRIQGFGFMAHNCGTIIAKVYITWGDTAAFTVRENIHLSGRGTQFDKGFNNI